MWLRWAGTLPRISHLLPMTVNQSNIEFAHQRPIGVCIDETLRNIASPRIILVVERQIERVLDRALERGPCIWRGMVSPLRLDCAVIKRHLGVAALQT